MKTEDSRGQPAIGPARRAAWLAPQNQPISLRDPSADGPAPDGDSGRQDLMPPPEPSWPRVFPGL
jgi:hypothetical protein